MIFNKFHPQTYLVLLALNSVLNNDDFVSKNGKVDISRLSFVEL
jgi:hypothetical protein